MSTANPSWTEPQRAVVALAMLGWAYLDLLRVGRTEQAAQVLVYFQSLFAQRKDDVIASYDDQSREAVSRILSANPVRATGMMDAATRPALIASLVVGWANVEAPLASSIITTMPADPSLVPGWFGSQVMPLAVGDSYVWQLARPLETTSQADVTGMLTAEVPPYIAGTPVPGPGPSTPAEPGPTTAGPVYPWIRQATAYMSTPLYDPQASTLPAGATPLEPMVVKQTATEFPTWGLWALGIGGLVAVGIVSWGVWGKR